MKKIVMTIALALGVMISVQAQNGGGVFRRGPEATEQGDKAGDGGLVTPGIPGYGHKEDQPAPLGVGIAVLAALGGAYLVAKKRKED